MKKIIFFLFLCISVPFFGQEHKCAIHKQAATANLSNHQGKMAMSPFISHEIKYDVKFVHLNLKVNRYNKYLAGNVKTVATVTAAALDTFMTLLHLNMAIDSIRFNGALLNFTRKDSMVKVKAPTPLINGASFTVVVHYKGTPPNGGGAIGSGFSNGTSGSWGNKATWSLSEALVGYHWWPCKQILTDKIDSSWVFVTTDSLNKAGSNGVLTNVVTIDSLKRFEWKSRKPIDYYLISVAVAKYKEYNLYAKPQYLVNDSILIQNYIYDAAINNPSFLSQKQDLNKMPMTMNFLCNMYGMYPFYKEKYGHCMAPFGGGMEHQTMTSLGFFDFYINAHELGHQWWGDNVTCKSWGDIWINEGFASYTEHLVAQYLDAPNFAGLLNSAHNNVMSLPGGSIFFTGSDTLNSNRIFSSRLTYDKGGAIIHSLRFLTNNDSTWFNTLRGFQNTFKNSTASAIDFKNFYQAQTGINPTQFFNQWYYGEGYPTFNIKYNFANNVCYIKNTQSVSMPTVTPLFITPLEYRISRAGYPDTTVRLMHTQAVENYSFALSGTITSMVCDPNNWLINKNVGPARDFTLGVEILPDAINEQHAGNFDFLIGPNPVRTGFSIEAARAGSFYASVLDINGRLLFRKAFETRAMFDLTSEVPGIYFVKIQDLSGFVTCTRKIVKE